MRAEATGGGASFVSAHLDQAHDLGDRLSELIDDPDAFLAALSEGLAGLTDPAYLDLVKTLSPDVATEYAVRGPLVEIVLRPIRGALRDGSSASALWLAHHLAGAEQRDVRLFALPCLRRALPEDPEQAWQLMRRMGAGAGDWVEVDSLADVWARGILAETFRWAELEQLVYSRRVGERRLVGATLATIPHRWPASRRAELGAGPSRRAFELIGQLMGDSAAMVQKALSWAIRAWTPVDPQGAADLLRDETGQAVGAADGARAWVIRDALSQQPVELAASLRGQLAGIRRDRHAPSTSIAAARSAHLAAVFLGAHDAVARQGDRTTRSRA